MCHENTSPSSACRDHGAAPHIAYPGSDQPLVAALVETGVAELLATELWRRQTA